MLDDALTTLKRGASKVAGNPQLIYTALVALLITGAFLFTAERFIGIANDAQERLVNVRIGSLQDAFVSFAGDRIGDSAYLNERIADIRKANETISDFRVVTKSPEGGYAIVAASDASAVGQKDETADFLYGLASSDTEHSLTIEVRSGNERFFRTARAITASDGSVLAVAMTTQTLSEADRAIEESIRNSIIALIGILFVLLLFFLRYSKVIDYMELYKKLKEVDQLKDDFISMASHELRTPLTVIRGYAEYIREAPELSEKSREYAVHIDTSARGLDALVADILDVSRIEQGRMTFKEEALSPLSVAEESIAAFTIPAKEKGLTLSLDAGTLTGTERISADPDRLRQVLTNLVGNAIKYTPKGSVTVKLSVEGGQVRFRISDTGLGIGAEEQKRLFEKFYRVSSEETKTIRGTGLGLWITARIVKEMRGAISVESIKGVGSHFIVSFPLYAQKDAKTK